VQFKIARINPRGKTVRLKGLAATLCDFRAEEPVGPVAISRPFNVIVHTPLGLQGLQSLKHRELRARYVFLQVPFAHQQHINLCGDASVNMLLAYYCKEQNDLTRNPRGIIEGLQSKGIVSQLKQKDINPIRVAWPVPLAVGDKLAWTTKTLCAALNKYGPIICSGRLPNDIVGHYVVLIGVSEDQAVYHDPWSGPKRTATLEQFNAFVDCSDNDAMIGASAEKRHNGLHD
jgi:hypothetical protein